MLIKTATTETRTIDTNLFDNIHKIRTDMIIDGLYIKLVEAAKNNKDINRLCDGTIAGHISTIKVEKNRIYNSILCYVTNYGSSKQTHEIAFINVDLNNENMELHCFKNPNGPDIFMPIINIDVFTNDLVDYISTKRLLV